MNLTFRVLWFDDTAAFFDSLDLDPFRSQVQSWGFQSSFDLVSTPDEFMRKEPFNDYDLIVVDYNLGDNQPHGETFIKRIRDHRIYTEVIFYSAQPSTNLWAAIGQAQLEGVYVANRQVILDKLSSVAHQSVHKVLDLNNMRGMVMAEVGDIDVTLASILQVGVTQLKGDQQEAIFNRFHKSEVKDIETKTAKLGAFQGKPELVGLIDLCDTSNKRWENFNRLKSRHATLKSIEIGDYLSDVLQPRNFLAHGKPAVTADGQVFEYQGKKLLFSEEVSLSLRRKILDYKQQFQKIHDTLSSTASAA
jgi:hypothetical protein